MKLYVYTKSYSSDRTEIASEGTRKAIHGLCSGFAACGIPIAVLCEGSEDAVIEMSEGYKILQFASPDQGFTFRVAPGLKHFIRTQLNQQSLVILNGIFQPNLYAMSSLLSKYRIPYAPLPNDPYSPALFGTKTWLKRVYWHLFEQRVLNRSTLIQVLDRRHEVFLRDLGVRNPVIEVPLGFSPVEVYPETDLQWHVDRPPQLFFLGRIDAYNKGLDLLIDAVASISDASGATLKLQGVDKGDRHALEQQIAALAMGDRISIHPPDYQTPAPLLIKHCDIFCLPSRFEGFGQTALEAMLVGRVLLVSESGGIAPHVEASGCGVVVKPEVDTIRAGILELLQRRSQWREMGLRGRQYALEHLQWNKIAATALKHYQQWVA